MRLRVAIIGAGIAGLYAAWRLRQAGVEDIVILEARARLGGRIETVSGPDGNHAYDLGATWFWPSIQPALAKVITELGLRELAQFEDGLAMADVGPSLPPRPLELDYFTPASRRLHGGMSALIQELASRLGATTVLTNHEVTGISRSAEGVRVLASTETGAATHLTVDKVFLAIPPRIAASRLSFEPPIDSDVIHQWGIVNTWMAPHAKYVALYDEPFWRASGLSGHIRSSVGPMAEVHDASGEEGGALFGFIALPAFARKAMSPEELKRRCRAQLQRVFGAAAMTPKGEFLRDWATERFTATDADMTPMAGHTSAVNIAGNSTWRDVLIPIASEWSASMPGYIAGALSAADAGLERLIATKTEDLQLENHP